MLTVNFTVLLTLCERSIRRMILKVNMYISHVFFLFLLDKPAVIS